MRPATVLMLVALVCANRAAAQQRLEKNIVYGMYSGLALLMDIHRPERPNGYGVVFIAGSGWSAGLTYGTTALKEGQISVWGPPLLRAGYTVFAINHRASPRFHYPAPVEDVQRAIRFVRHHGRRFGIDPGRIGGVGGSSGGHLIGLTAMLGAPGITGDSDPVNQEPATLQCIVLRAAPTDLKKMIGGSATGTGAVALFLGRMLRPDPGDQEIYRAASPVAHVSASSPPVLLVHGDADDTVPYEQSESMEKALLGAKATVELIRVPGGGHGASFAFKREDDPRLTQALNESVQWLDRYLKVTPKAK
jgi:acetyl esterase/lipase